MSFFGIPFILSWEQYLSLLNNFQSTGYLEQFLSSAYVIPMYVISNFLLLYFWFKIFIPFLYRLLIFFKNRF